MLNRNCMWWPKTIVSITTLSRHSALIYLSLFLENNPSQFQKYEQLLDICVIPFKWLLKACRDAKVSSLQSDAISSWPCWGSTWQWSGAAHWFSRVHGQPLSVQALQQRVPHSPASQRLWLSGGMLSSTLYPTQQKEREKKAHTTVR